MLLSTFMLLALAFGSSLEFVCDLAQVRGPNVDITSQVADCDQYVQRPQSRERAMGRDNLGDATLGPILNPPRNIILRGAFCTRRQDCAQPNWMAQQK